jgi:hypothetical protein
MQETQAQRDARRRAARRWRPPTLDAPRHEEFNKIGLDFQAEATRMPRAIDGPIIDSHSHLLAADHADAWFAAADAFGIDHTVTMTPLEEVLRLQRTRHASRTTIIAVPAWQPDGYHADRFWPRVQAYHDLGSRVVKFHLAPATMAKSGLRLGSDRLREYVRRAVDLGMVVMTHVGDPATWYESPERYGNDPEFWGTRREHYDAWEELLDSTRGHPWWGAHLGGWPERPDELRRLLRTYPDLVLDLSATKWMVREVSARADEYRSFCIEFQDRLLWGSDQVSQQLRGFDFYASRWWCHRKLWETDHVGDSPIHDGDVACNTVQLRGTNLPTEVLTKLYQTNIQTLLARVGVKL